MVFKERGTLVQPREKVIHVCDFFSIYILLYFSVFKESVLQVTLHKFLSKSAGTN